MTTEVKGSYRAGHVELAERTVKLEGEGEMPDRQVVTIAIQAGQLNRPLKVLSADADSVASKLMDVV
jgi:hypothetical protein